MLCNPVSPLKGIVLVEWSGRWTDTWATGFVHFDTTPLLGLWWIMTLGDSRRSGGYCYYNLSTRAAHGYPISYNLS